MTWFTYYVSYLEMTNGRDVHLQGLRINMEKQVVINSGIGLGSAITVAISWSVNKSIMWAAIHGFFSWFYVLYYHFAIRG